MKTSGPMTSRKLNIVQKNPGASSIRIPSCHRLGRRARLAVDLQHLLDRLRRGQIEAVQRFACNCGDIEKADAAAEERGDGYLIRGIEDSRFRRSARQRRPGEAQRRETLQIGLLEIERSDRGPDRAVRTGVSIRSGQARLWAIGIRMSGAPSWARTEPSSYSTRLWITDWGWMTISNAPLRAGTGGRPRSARDPCSSGSRNRPRSWRPSTNWGGPPPGRASPAHLVEAPVRNGPPLAVRMIRRTRPAGRGRSIGRSHYARN